MSTSHWTRFESELEEAVGGFAGCDDQSLVLGEGNREAGVVFIGEAPGAQEDKAGRPFVGPAGRLLDELLEEVGLERESVWITNVVKCRPTEVKNGRTRNRPPSQQEFDDFLPWLERELKLVKPEMLVCLGATAAKAVLGRKSVKLGDIRGSWQEGVLGIDTLVTYHPSFLLRRTSNRDDRYADMVADLKLVRGRLG
ncbi:MAG: uracil-DNA glycosylase [Thermomicrobiaceae bacterium]